jgi:hypothetical protein
LAGIDIQNFHIKNLILKINNKRGFIIYF